jgi:hypothetical protein
MAFLYLDRNQVNQKNISSITQNGGVVPLVDDSDKRLSLRSYRRAIIAMLELNGYLKTIDK